MAFGKLTLTGYEFGRTPEEINDAQSELDAMMLEWPYSGLGYVDSPYGVGSPDEQSGIPNNTLAAVAGGLAIRLAANMGRSLPPEAVGSINKSFALLQASVATIPIMPMEHNTVRGAGARSTFGPFIQETSPVTIDEDPGDLAGLIE